MAAPQSNALRHWARIIQRWPVDKNSGMQLPDAPPLPTPKRDPKAPPVEPRIWDENKELQQTNVLYALLENKFSKQYPMPQSLRHPASSPTHYDDLVAEMSEAPSRSWFANVVKRFKGSLRLS